MAEPLRKVLYIDDDDDLLGVVQLSLEELGGYSVTTCSNGNDGVEVALASRPDLIMLDVMMPEIDGPATLKRIRGTSGLENIPVIFMTARSSESQSAGYIALGAAGTISKPFDPFQLAGKVAELWQNLPENRANNEAANQTKPSLLLVE